MQGIRKRAGVCLVVWGCSQAALALTSEEEALMQVYGDMPMVSIATGRDVPIHKAPSTATVITADQIEAIGAHDLNQVLEMVPGLHVIKSNIAMKPLYGMRGVATADNQQVLMLLNGTPINSGFLGDRSQIWGEMPVHNIARVELIRGPGSALYGADAFAGVINVITKNGRDVSGLTVGGKLGSFSTGEAWMQYGGDWGPINSFLYLRTGKTDGGSGVIEQDFQSTIDGIAGTKASLAPGAMSEYRKGLDLNVDLAYGAWRFRHIYQKRLLGMGAGLAGALDPVSRTPESRWYSDLAYSQDNWLPTWDLQATLSYQRFDSGPADPWYQLLPPGTNTAPLLTAMGAAGLGGVFPNGLRGNPGHDEDGYHARMSTLYKGWTDHQLRLGVGYRTQDLYAVQEAKDFFLVLHPLPGGYRDVSNDASLVYLQPHKRNVKYAFVQDEWNFARDWSATAGLRYDRYSDFGSTTNPRLALVWNAGYNWTVKAMYGEAFRAPSFVEQYNINNPVRNGNAQLRPERIATKELSVNWQVSANLNTNFDLYRYTMQDMIRLDRSRNNTFFNMGDQTGYGLEWAFDYKVDRDFKLAGHIALQKSKDEAATLNAGMAPEKQFQLRADWRVASFWNLNAIVNHVAERKRQPTDLRPAVADYTTLDLNLRGEKLAGDWTAQASVRNVFNEHALEPSFLDANMPSDLPMDSRGVYFQLEHHWD